MLFRSEAKDISEKYIAPPKTTNFGIMFLPFEGLYSEVVRLGLVEVLQRDYKVNIAGPTTMAATLNSLQMGFKTLAIQKRTSEVWEILGAVKTEFAKFEAELEKAQKNVIAAGGDACGPGGGDRQRQRAGHGLSDRREFTSLKSTFPSSETARRPDTSRI